MQEIEAETVSNAAVDERTNNGEVNNKLEDLRNRALNSNGTEALLDDLQQLIRDSSRVHAAFLFHSPKVLQPLLRAIGETSSVSYEANWQTFGDKLGLDVTLLKVINNNQFNHEDPVYNTLLNYVQYGDATIGKIIEALVEIGRLDVVTRTKDVIKELVRVIFETEQNMLQSGRRTYSIQSSGELPTMNSDVLLRPLQIPSAPFIIQNVQSTPLLSTLLLQNMTESRKSVICSQKFSQALAIEAVPEMIQQSSPTPTALSAVSMNSNIEGRRSPYSKKVMLTFADDAADIGFEIARILRQPRGTDRIGVLVLEEHTANLEADPSLFICASLHMMDYVIPILTKGYMQTILKKSEALRADSVDARYVPFIYQTLMQDYSRRGCRNTKVRCLIPDDQVDSLLDHLMMASPLFSSWERCSRVESLAQRILSSQA